MKAVSFKETVVLRRWESSDKGLTLETSALKVLITLSTSLIISNHLKEKKKKNNKVQYSLTDNTRHNMHSCHSKKTRQPQSMKKTYKRNVYWVTCAFKAFYFSGGLQVIVSQTTKYKYKRDHSHQDEGHCYHIHDHYRSNQQTKLNAEQNQRVRCLILTFRLTRVI